MSAQPVLAAFNGQLNLLAAYQWSIEKIFEFLEDVIARPDDYGVPEENTNELCTIKDEINDLSFPSGREYRAPGLEPDQHILRDLNPSWQTSQPPQSVSKFLVKKKQHWAVPYWNNYDLLGLFLSSLGPAPANATKESFYLPLVCMYGRWCAQIGSKTPFLYSCCFRSRGERDFFLGASLEGYAWDYELTGRWKPMLQMARFSLVNTERFRLTNWSFDVSPKRQTDPVRGARFGNCAETLPFIHLLMGHPDYTPPCDVFGVAVRRRAFQQCQYSFAGMSRHCVNPCQNCQELIEMYDGRIENFMR